MLILYLALLGAALGCKNKTVPLEDVPTTTAPCFCETDHFNNSVPYDVAKAMVPPLIPPQTFNQTVNRFRLQDSCQIKATCAAAYYQNMKPIAHHHFFFFADGGEPMNNVTIITQCKNGKLYYEDREIKSAQCFAVCNQPTND